MKVTTEQGLRDIYYHPAAGYQSAERLYQKAREEGISVSRKMVREWLKTQDTYTRYKPVVRQYKFQKTFVKDLADQIQMDLVDMGKYKNKNKGYYWILTAVEILSRYASTIPVYRKDSKNMKKAVDLLYYWISLRQGLVSTRMSLSLTRGTSSITWASGTS